MIIYYLILILFLLLINFIIFNNNYLCLLISCLFLLLMILIDKKYYIDLLKTKDETKLLNSFFDLVIILNNKYYGKKLINEAFKKSFKNGDIANFENDKFDIICYSINKNISLSTLINIINLLKEDNRLIDKDIKIIDYMRYILLFVILNTLLLIFIHPAFNDFFINKRGFIIILIVYCLFLIIYLILCRIIYLKNNSNNRYLLYFKCYCLINNPIDEFDNFCLISKEFGESIYTIKKAIIEKNDDYLMRFIFERKKEKELIIYIINTLKENKLIEENYLIKKDMMEGENIVKIFILLYLLCIIYIYMFEVIYI